MDDAAQHAVVLLSHAVQHGCQLELSPEILGQKLRQISRAIFLWWRNPDAAIEILSAWSKTNPDQVSEMCAMICCDYPT